MHWEVGAIVTKDFLKEAESTSGLDIAKVVDKVLAKFKNSDEFVALLKKFMTLDLMLGWRLFFTTSGHAIETLIMLSW